MPFKLVKNIIVTLSERLLNMKQTAYEQLPKMSICCLFIVHRPFVSRSLNGIVILLPRRFHGWQ